MQLGLYWLFYWSILSYAYSIQSKNLNPNEEETQINGLGNS
jgi:hypothetical protein